MAKYNTEDRRNMADKGHALPDGSFPIADVEDLRSAIRNWALGKQPTKAKAHIIKRARALSAMDVLPSKWMGSVVQHDDAVDEFLVHNGVKGMKWGIVKDTPTGASRKTDREAHRDANEFAKAKLFYGEGAGTRRKLIKATVEAKSKKDPEYKKAFDHHVENQDLAKRASQARGERKRKDVSNSAAKNARSIHRLATGGMGNVTMAASVVVGAYGVAKATGYDKVVINAGKQTLTTAINSPAAKAVRDAFLKG